MVEITDTDGSIIHSLNGEYHRPNGPAWVDKSTNNGYWWWFLFGRYHRYYGPMSNSDVWSIHGEWLKW